MTNIKQIFLEKSAYIAYLTGGQIGHDATIDAAKALQQGGVDILEFGLPFSDPIADGPVIQQAMETSLSRGTNFNQCLKMIADIKKATNMPIILFGYANVFLAQINRINDLKDIGVDNILMVDIALEEMQQEPFLEITEKIPAIYLLSPSTPDERIKAMDQACDSFLYYVSRNGTTGEKTGFPDDFAQKLNSINAIVKNPVVTGFGISSRDLARQACEHTAGFVVGSYFIKAIQNGADAQKLEKLARDLDPR